MGRSRKNVSFCPVDWARPREQGWADANQCLICEAGLSKKAWAVARRQVARRHKFLLCCASQPTAMPLPVGAHSPLPFVDIASCMHVRSVLIEGCSITLVRPALALGTVEMSEGGCPCA